MKLQDLIGKTVTKIERGVGWAEDELRIYSGDEVIAIVLNEGTLFDATGMYFEDYSETALAADARRIEALDRAMKPKRDPQNPPLVLSFELGSADHTFLVTLPNGAQFTCDERHLGGKLADNLRLYAKACQRERASASCNPLPSEGIGDYRVAVERYLEKNQITKVGVLTQAKLPAGKKLTLADLNLGPKLSLADLMGEKK